MTWVRVLAVDELWQGEKRRVAIGEGAILLVRLESGVVAFEDRCAHLGLPLSEGRLEGDALTCAAHDWIYDLRTGRGINPCAARLKAIPVTIIEGVIWIDSPHVPLTSRTGGERGAV